MRSAVTLDYPGRILTLLGVWELDIILDTISQICPIELPNCINDSLLTCVLVWKTTVPLGVVMAPLPLRLLLALPAWLVLRSMVKLCRGLPERLDFLPAALPMFVPLSSTTALPLWDLSKTGELAAELDRVWAGEAVRPDSLSVNFEMTGARVGLFSDDMSSDIVTKGELCNMVVSGLSSCGSGVLGVRIVASLMMEVPEIE